MTYLRQSTIATITMGPFVDETDAKTPETALSLAVKVSKNGAALAARNDATAIAHDADGYYPVVLDATDTATIGRMRATASPAGALPVWEDFEVVDEAVYDVLFGTVAPAVAGDAMALTSGERTTTVAAFVAALPEGVPDQDLVDLFIAGLPEGVPASTLATTFRDVDNTSPAANSLGAAVNDGIGGGAAPTVVEIRQEMDANSTKLVGILADTAEIQTDWANGGRLDLILDTAAEKTGMKLAADGLDSIAITAPTGLATTFPAMVVQTWRRFFKRATKSTTQILTYADNDVTILTTQAISETETDETQGAAS